MHRITGWLLAAWLLSALPAAAQPASVDTTAHGIQMVKVADGVELEVVDWGGSGRPLVFLSGLFATAHAFDNFAPRFTGQYHVYGITRRGIGASGKPDAAIAANYRADRLGDDVLAVLVALKLEKPVLAGWSIAGVELSSVATRHPDKVAGLVYLDAASAHALYTPGLVTSVTVSIPDAQAKLALLGTGDNASLFANEAVIDRLVATDLPQLISDLRAVKAAIVETRKLVPAGTPIPPPPPPTINPGTAIQKGVQKYGVVHVPVLAIYAVTQVAPNVPANMKPLVEMGIRTQEGVANAYRKANPAAKVVAIRGARHDIFNSHADDVTREMNDFLAATLR